MFLCVYFFLSVIIFLFRRKFFVLTFFPFMWEFFFFKEFYFARMFSTMSPHLLTGVFHHFFSCRSFPLKLLLLLLLSISVGMFCLCLCLSLYSMKRFLDKLKLHSLYLFKRKAHTIIIPRVHIQISHFLSLAKIQTQSLIYSTVTTSPGRT